MSTQPAIVVSALRKSFGSVTAVDRLSFEVFPGEIFGLVGPDGSGKTTTLRMLAGVLTPESGSAVVADHDILTDAEGAKHDLSYMPQRFGLYEDLTVAENIRFYADLFGVSSKERERRSSELLTAAGLGEFRGRLAGKLSGGMKQKLGLVCALIHRPRVILLDEPTNGVDPVSRRDFWKILYALIAEGVAILISTSYLDEAERCHRVGLIHRGSLLFCDKPSVLKEQFHGAVVAIHSIEPELVRDAVCGINAVQSTLLEGDRVHVFVDDAVRAIPQLRSQLDALAIPYSSIEQVPPTIEDLFVTAVQEHPTPLIQKKAS